MICGTICRLDHCPTNVSHSLLNSNIKSNNNSCRNCNSNMHSNSMHNYNCCSYGSSALAVCLCELTRSLSIYLIRQIKVSRAGNRLYPCPPSPPSCSYCSLLYFSMCASQFAFIRYRHTAKHKIQIQLEDTHSVLRDEGKLLSLLLLL